MVNLSDNFKTVMFLLSFLGIFAFLTSTMPIAFKMSGYGAETAYNALQMTYPDTPFSKEKMGSYQYVLAVNVSEGLIPYISGDNLFDFSTATNPIDISSSIKWIGEEIRFIYHGTQNLLPFGLLGVRKDYNMHIFKGNAQIEYLINDTIIDYWDYVTGNYSEIFPVWHEEARVTFTVWFYDYNRTRNNWNSAFDEGLIGVWIGFGITDVEMGAIGYEGFMDLMTFQEVDINPAINYMIALPIWIAFITLLIIVALEAIPFVG